MLMNAGVIIFLFPSCVYFVQGDCRQNHIFPAFPLPFLILLLSGKLGLLMKLGLLERLIVKYS